MDTELKSRITMLVACAATAVASVYVLAAMVDFEEQIAAAPIALVVGGLIIGWGVGFQLAPAALFLVALPPIWQSLPQDDWIGFFTLFILCLVYLPAAGLGAGLGATLRMTTNWLSRP